MDLHIRNIPGLTQRIASENPDKMRVWTSARLGVRNNQLVDVILQFKVTADSSLIGREADGIEIISMTPIVTFEIQGVEPHLDDNGQVVLGPEIMFGLISAAIGTSRGIFWSKMMGTQYDGVSLPLIGHEQLLEMVGSYQRITHEKAPPNYPPNQP